MEFMLWIWVAIVALSAIIEFVSVQMVSIWFAVGGIAALIAYACTAPYWAQIIVFFAVSFVCLICFRKVALKWILKNVKGKTNSDALIGVQIKLQTPVTVDDEGSASIGDVVWSVIGKDGFTAPEGERVEIVDIVGNKLVVDKITE